MPTRRFVFAEIFAPINHVFAPINHLEKDVSHRYSSHDDGVKYVKIFTHNYPQVQFLKNMEVIQSWHEWNSDI